MTPYEQDTIEPTIQKLAEIDEWATRQMASIDEWAQRTNAMTDGLAEARDIFDEVRSLARLQIGRLRKIRQK